MEIKNSDIESVMSHNPKVDLIDNYPVEKNISKQNKVRFKKKINKKVLWTVLGIFAAASVIAAIVCGFVC